MNKMKDQDQLKSITCIKQMKKIYFITLNYKVLLNKIL